MLASHSYYFLRVSINKVYKNIIDNYFKKNQIICKKSPSLVRFMHGLYIPYSQLSRMSVFLDHSHALFGNALTTLVRNINMEALTCVSRNYLAYFVLQYVLFFFFLDDVYARDCNNCVSLLAVGRGCMLGRTPIAVVCVITGAYSTTLTPLPWPLFYSTFISTYFSFSNILSANNSMWFINFCWLVR